ncbi:MAG TPA: GLPGLI family protein [Flavobacteriaceae bacterium]|nr:GLPGLI family protein [Flavobacteriaceae bacterium]
MKNILLLTFSIFLSQLGIAQKQFGKVTYKINSPDAKELADKSIKREMSEASKLYIEQRLRRVVTTLPYVELELFFSPYEAVLNVDNHMKNENQLDIKSALARTATNGTYYSNIKEDIFLHETVSFSVPYLIKTPFNELEWEIHDETKEILGYTCIKATTTLEYPFNDFPTTVWFAPELPFPFGPKEFRGLPGLILAMEFNHFYFYANAIDLDIKSMRIKKPSKGREVSQTKYFEELKEHDRAFLKSIGEKRE